jgi:hypothetical protein
VNRLGFLIGATLLAGAATAACGLGSDGGPRQGSAQTDGDGGAASIAPSGGSVRAPYQVKTSAEIAAAVQACFGPAMTTVAASMIQTQDNPAGFLSARQFTAGADVVAGEASIFDGDPSVERVGVRNATLSLPILAGLQDIGNVVGENCAASQGANPLCDCTTPDSAKAMLVRCLPSIDPTKYASLQGSFADKCAQQPATAIASLIASTAFGIQ